MASRKSLTEQSAALQKRLSASRKKFLRRFALHF